MLELSLPLGTTHWLHTPRRQTTGPTLCWSIVSAFSGSTHDKWQPSIACGPPLLLCHHLVAFTPQTTCNQLWCYVGALSQLWSTHPPHRKQHPSIMLRLSFPPQHHFYPRTTNNWPQHYTGALFQLLSPLHMRTGTHAALEYEVANKKHTDDLCGDARPFPRLVARFMCWSHSIHVVITTFKYISLYPARIICTFFLFRKQCSGDHPSFFPHSFKLGHAMLVMAWLDSPEGWISKISRKAIQNTMNLNSTVEVQFGLDFIFYNTPFIF